VRLIATDPNKSNSGFMFAGLTANLLAGDVADETTLPKVLPQVVDLFRIMGFKSNSSGQVFDDFIAGGPGADPLVVGYENQLVEWIMADPDRWKRVMQSPVSQPVTLYPQPTVYSAHPLIALAPESLALIDAMMSAELQTIGWQDHGFRGPLGAIGATTNPLVAGRMPAEVSAVAPMPDVNVMLAILDALAAPGVTAPGSNATAPVNAA
jgi:hypothetical protein